MTWQRGDAMNTKETRPGSGAGAAALGCSLGAGILILTALVLGCSSSPPPQSAPGAPPPQSAPGAPPPQSAAGEPPPAGAQGGVVRRQMNYRFNMDSPANDEFAFYDDFVFIYARPYDEYMSMKVQARRQIPIKILWSESEFVDVIGRRYRLVPPSVTMDMAARNIIPPTELRADDLFTGRVLLLDPTQKEMIRNLGGTPFPVVPLDAGTPEQVRNKSFTMRLMLEINANRQTYDFIFSILDAFYRAPGEQN
jgi:hypothetical protein